MESLSATPDAALASSLDDVSRSTTDKTGLLLQHVVQSRSDIPLSDTAYTLIAKLRFWVLTVGEVVCSLMFEADETLRGCRGHARLR